MMDAAAVARDASLIPHAMPDDRHFAFRRVTPADLRRASFLDGRMPVGEPAEVCPIAHLIAAAPTSQISVPLPTIFHVSFCGSTLLSRLLDVPGDTQVYREPAIQIALADRLVAGMPVDTPLNLATQLLGRPVADARPIVKPSNWANVLLPAFTSARNVRPLFITMRPRAFLTAVFRGGRDRMAFTMRAANHFAKALPDGHAMMAEAMGADRVPLAQAARLTLVALELQLRLFASAQTQFGTDAILDEQDIRRDPQAATAFAADALGLAHFVSGIAGESGAHAKDPAQRFSSAAEAQANDLIIAEHGPIFDAALRWAAKAGLFAD